MVNLILHVFELWIIRIDSRIGTMWCIFLEKVIQSLFENNKFF